MATYDETLSLTSVAALSCAGVATATYLWFSGAETGQADEFPHREGAPTVVESPVRTGGFSLRVPPGSQAAVEIGNDLTTGQFRGSVFAIAAPAEPAVIWETQVEAGASQFRLYLNPDSTLSLAFADAEPLATSTVKFAYNRWNQIECTFVESATVGGATVYLNNTAVIDSLTHDTLEHPSGAHSMNRWAFGDQPGDGGVTFWYDDLAAGTGRKLGPGECRMVRPSPLGTPTETGDWLIEGTTSAARAWSDDDPETWATSGPTPDSYETAPLRDFELDPQTVIHAACVRALVATSDGSAGPGAPAEHTLASIKSGITTDYEIEVDAEVGGTITEVTGEVKETPPFGIELAELAAWEIGGKTTDDGDNGTLFISEMWAMLDVLPPPQIAGGLAGRARARFTATITPADTGDNVEPFLFILPEVIV